MMKHAPPATSSSRASLATRIAMRDFRGGLSDFGIFLACIALGVAAIVGVGSVSRSLSDGLSREGRRVLGGDASFILMHRELAPPERSFLEGAGRISSIASMRAMAQRSSGVTALVEIKAVPENYPSLGTVVIDPVQSVQTAVAQRDGIDGFVAEATLSARLDLKIGDRIRIGDGQFEYRGELISEPDKLSGGIGFGPRVILSLDAFRRTGLLQPGSLVRWLNRVTLTASSSGLPASATDLTRVLNEAKQNFPEAGWEVRTRDNISPQFEKNLEKLTLFLTLVGLTALIVGGVGVANSVSAYVDRKRLDFASLKALGASGGYVFFIGLIQVLLIAFAGIAIGSCAGAAIPYLINFFVGARIPFPFQPAIFPNEIAAGALFGLLTALAFSFGALGRSHDTPVSALFRDQVEPDRHRTRTRYIVGFALIAVIYGSAIVALASDRKVAIGFIVATLSGYLLLRLVSIAICAIAQRAPKFGRIEWRLAVANIYRPGALTPSVVTSLGLGLALLSALTMIDGNVRAQLNRGITAQTPSFFFLDIRNSEVASFADFLRSHAPTAKIEQAPMMRGRVVRLNDQRPEDVKANESVAWVLEGDRGITYSQAIPEGSSLSAGEWWTENYQGPPLVSVEASIAEGLRLHVGDSVTVNVLGRNLTARIANFRTVNWRTLGINFVFVFSPNTFVNAPHTWLATATFPSGSSPKDELPLLSDVARTFPTVTAIRVRDALEAIATAVAQLGLSVRAASSIALVASVLVLAGAVAAGRRTRVYDTVILKTLGATRFRLLLSLVYEYAILATATAIFGIMAGTLAAWLVVTQLMKIEQFQWLWSAAASTTAIALVITIAFGLLGTFRALGQKPASYLRNL